MNRKTIILGGICVLAIIIIGLQFSHIIHDNKVLFKIENESYNLRYVKKVIKYSENNSKPADGQNIKLYSRSIYDQKIREQAAKSLDIEVSKKDLDAVSSKSNIRKPNNKVEKDYYNTLIFNQALNNKLVLMKNGGYSGYVFVFNFSKNMMPPAAQEPKFTPNYTVTDKIYAEQKAKLLRDQYINKQIDSEGLINTINSDPKISFGNMSSVFVNSTVPLEDQIQSKEIYDYVIKIEKPSITPLSTGKMNIASYTEKPNYVDGYIYFVDLQKKGKNDTNVDKLIAEKINKMNKEYYVK